MAKYGSADLTISADVNDMSDYVDTVNDVMIEALLQEGTAFGDSWVEQLSTGIKRGSPVTMEGFFDDTAATGPDVTFNALGTTLAMILTWGSTKTSTFSAIVTNYGRKPMRGELTRFTVTLLPVGAVVEA